MALEMASAAAALAADSHGQPKLLAIQNLEPRDLRKDPQSQLMCILTAAGSLSVTTGDVEHLRAQAAFGSKLQPSASAIPAWQQLLFTQSRQSSSGWVGDVQSLTTADAFRTHPAQLEAALALVSAAAGEGNLQGSEAYFSSPTPPGTALWVAAQQGSVQLGSAGAPLVELSGAKLASVDELRQAAAKVPALQLTWQQLKPTALPAGRSLRWLLLSRSGVGLSALCR